MPKMQAETLNCPNCGAATATDAPLCQFCGSRLATIACPKCFAMMFIGSKHCPRCGSAATLPAVDDSKPRNCPRCRTAMVSVSIGNSTMVECEKCFGLWLDVASFQKICVDREQQSAVLGSPGRVQASSSFAPDKVKYVPCPECAQLMNRMNFARCSGVVVDICKQHGTWFDRDELSRIVEFISGGGLEVSRAKERMEIADERERLRQAQRDIALHGSSVEDHRLSGIASTKGLLKFLIEKD